MSSIINRIFMFLVICVFWGYGVARAAFPDPDAMFTSNGIQYVTYHSSYDPSNHWAAVVGTVDTLTVVYIPDSIEYNGVIHPVKTIYDIGQSIVELRIPPTVQSLSEEDFKLPKLRKLRIGMAYIHFFTDDYFDNWQGLRHIIFEETVRDVYLTSFLHCYDLMTMTFMSSDVSIYRDSYLLEDFEYRNGFREHSSLIKYRVPPGTASIFRQKLGDYCYIVEQSLTDADADFIVDSISYKIKSADEVAVTGVALGMRDLTIPEWVVSPEGNSYHVVGLEKYAISFHEQLRSVTIPASVVAIDNKAFARNYDIEKIVVDDDNPVFDTRDDCCALIRKADNTLLYACKNTIIPNSIERIGNEAFVDCQVMTHPVAIPASVKSIGYKAFYKNQSLPSDLSLQGDLELISSEAFARCTSIKSLTIGSKVKNIYTQAFRWCKNLKQINYNARNCNVSTGLDYSSESGELYNDFFWLSISPPDFGYDGTFLEKVIVGDGVESLPNEIFAYQARLRSVELPSSLQVIKLDAFNGCSSLDTIICHAAVPPTWVASNEGVGVKEGCILMVPKNAMNAYANTWPWSLFAIEPYMSPNTTGPDVNDDGVVDISDVNIVINAILAKYNQGIPRRRCDLNGDGSIDIADVNLLINALLGKDDNPSSQGHTRMFTVNGVSFGMVAVDGGSFIMGGTAEQGQDVADNEIPTHTVTLSDYLIGQTEVTQELWQAVMDVNPSRFTGNLKRPVENVSWQDCQIFINRLNELTGQSFRMPTEAEWEFAARGGRRSMGFKWAGSDEIGLVAWTNENSGALGSDNPDYGTHPVATKQPNELDVYDMTGNVMEWCADWYGNYSTEAQTDPTGPEAGTERARRGGGWNYSAPYCRNSFRGHSSMTSTSPGVGLRLAM